MYFRKKEILMRIQFWKYWREKSSQGKAHGAAGFGLLAVSSVKSLRI